MNSETDSGKIILGVLAGLAAGAIVGILAGKETQLTENTHLDEVDEENEEEENDTLPLLSKAVKTVSEKLGDTATKSK